MNWCRGRLLLHLSASRDQRALDGDIYYGLSPASLVLSGIAALVRGSRPSSSIPPTTPICFDRVWSLAVAPCLALRLLREPKELGLFTGPVLRGKRLIKPYNQLETWHLVAFGGGFSCQEARRRLQFNIHQRRPLISISWDRPESVCFLAAHDAVFQVFMTMKHTLSPSTSHQNLARATSSSSTSRKGRRAS